MPLNLPEIPNFNVQTPDILGYQEKQLQLKNLAGQQQLLPLQIQEQQQKIQQNELAMEQAKRERDSQQSMMDAISNGSFNKYAGVETKDGTGFDAAGAYQDLIKNHKVLPQHASAAVNSVLKIAQDNAELRKTQGQAGEAQLNIRKKTFDALATKFGSIQDMPASDAPKALADLKADLVENPDAYKGLTPQEMEHIQAADLEHLKPMTSLMGLEGSIADYHKSKADAAKAQQSVIDPKTGLSPDTTQEINKEISVATNPQIQQSKINIAKAEANARQSAAQGDPNDAGAMLAKGDLTLADLKSRGTTPQYITKAVAAAQKINPNYNPADEVIAEHVAKSPAANQFFGSANSLIEKGGTLDQLVALGKKIPQHDFPVLNTIDDWQEAARGKGPLAAYAAMALGVADDYGKVMGGGTASDHARDAALKLFSQAASPEAREQAVSATRGAVLSQRSGRIGKNQFLQRQYGAGELGGGGETKIYQGHTYIKQSDGSWKLQS